MLVEAGEEGGVEAEEVVVACLREEEAEEVSCRAVVGEVAEFWRGEHWEVEEAGYLNVEAYWMVYEPVAVVGADWVQLNSSSSCVRSHWTGH
jgi:hypothetical protein